MLFGTNDETVFEDPANSNFVSIEVDLKRALDIADIDDTSENSITLVEYISENDMVSG